jgi:CRISPR-associated protein Cas1
VLRRALRDHGESLDAERSAALAAAADRLTAIARKAEVAPSVDLLRGLEGEAAHLYFAVFDHLIRVDDPELRFAGRSRRPPLDAVNALLSFLYTLL